MAHKEMVSQAMVWTFPIMLILDPQKDTFFKREVEIGKKG